jgi:hypothetical protein
MLEAPNRGVEVLQAAATEDDKNGTGLCSVPHRLRPTPLAATGAAADWFMWHQKRAVKDIMPHDLKVEIETLTVPNAMPVRLGEAAETSVATVARATIVVS